MNEALILRHLDVKARLMERARKAALALARKGMEGLALYRPLPAAAMFHDSKKRIRLLDGSNQSGKTLAAMAEVAMAVMGNHPTGTFPKENGRAILVGYDGDHLADPMFRTLCRQGAFSTIRDEQTGKVRSVRPDLNDPKRLDPYDAAYREKWRDAPPLLPERAIKHIAFEDTGKGIPRVIQLHNGWQLLWRSSKSKPVRGRQFHLWQFDEEIENDQFLPEVLRGCMRFSGRGFWSATPQTGGLQLYELRQRADAGDPDVAAFTLLLDDNPFYPDEEKQAFWRALSDEEREVRYYGRYAILGRRLYPMFNPQGDHGCEPFEPPQTWTRYLILDPGRMRCGTLFGAIDPDERNAWVYGGFALRNADAQRWAERVRGMQGSVRFEAAIIDKRAGKQHPMGASDTVARQYFDALTRAGVMPRRLGPLAGFFPGSDDVKAREEALLDWLHLRGDGAFLGSPRLKIMRGVFPELEREIRNAQYDGHKSDKRLDLEEDCLDCLEYWAASKPGYYPPELVAKRPREPVYEDWLKRAQGRQSQDTFTCALG